MEKKLPKSVLIILKLIWCSISLCLTCQAINAVPREERIDIVLSASKDKELFDSKLLIDELIKSSFHHDNKSNLVRVKSLSSSISKLGFKPGDELLSVNASVFSTQNTIFEPLTSSEAGMGLLMMRIRELVDGTVKESLYKVRRASKIIYIRQVVEASKHRSEIHSSGISESMIAGLLKNKGICTPSECRRIEIMSLTAKPSPIKIYGEVDSFRRLNEIIDNLNKSEDFVNAMDQESKPVKGNKSITFVISTSVR